MFKIEAMTVCVKYGGEFRETVKHNRPLVDRLFVATTPNDHDVIDLAREYSCELLLTEDVFRDGKFNKARAINRLLAAVEGSDWLMHIDSDIVLPVDLQDVLKDAHIDEACIYGCDRLNVTGYEAWKWVEAKGLRCRTTPWCIDLTPPDCKIGARVLKRGYGYSPIGFFQLWHGGTQMVHGMPSKLYPMVHGTAARTDEQHALQWDRRKRILIPELIVWHLESEPAKMGANWNGRSTPPFGPSQTIAKSGSY